MKAMNWKPSRLLTLCLLLAAGLAGCSQSAQQAQPNLTLTALSQSVSLASTASSQSSSQADKLATAQAKATESSQNIFATQTAQVDNRDQAALATATVIAPIVAELAPYGLDGSSGRLGWLHDPFSLDLTAYQDFAYGNDHMNVIAGDFVLSADILWDTQYGSSGCGFMFRSDGDQNKPSQYMVIASRFANGRVVFTAVDNGDIANFKDFYPKDNDRSFDWQNGSTNRLAVVARGSLIEIYTNGAKIGEVDTTEPPKAPVMPAAPQLPADQNNQAAMNAYRDQLAQYEDITKQARLSYQTALKNNQDRQPIFDEGFLAMIAVSESGHTICTFNNAWLWLLEP
jgi:hypothetical protein